MWLKYSFPLVAQILVPTWLKYSLTFTDTAFVNIEQHPQKNDTVLASYCSIDAYNKNGVTEGVVHKM